MTDDHTHSGMAALTICEALLLALNDAQILPEKEIMGVLKDAATTMRTPLGPRSMPKSTGLRRH